MPCYPACRITAGVITADKITSGTIKMSGEPLPPTPPAPLPTPPPPTDPVPFPETEPETFRYDTTFN